MGSYQTELKMKYYSKVMETYHSTGYSATHLSKIFPLSRNTILRWIRNFDSENNKSVFMKTSDNTVVPNKSSFTESNEMLPDDVDSLQAKIKELEAQLKKESIRADFYDEMINVAEAKFNIPIRKKAGTKQ